MTHLKDYLLEVYNQEIRTEEFESWHENISRWELADYLLDYLQTIAGSSIELSRVAEVILENQ